MEVIVGLNAVVMQKHLAEVRKNHKTGIRKKNPAIADFSDALKKANVIDLPQRKSIQYLGDVRNLCDHSKVMFNSPKRVQYHD